MNKYYKALELLAELAGEYGDNTYSVVDHALGFIPFKNNENKVKEVGMNFQEVARWLLDESKNNFNEHILKED